MPKPDDLAAIFRLEFYKHQQDWKFRNGARKKDAQLKTREKPLDETYNLEQAPSCLNDAFLQCSDKDLPLSEPLNSSATVTKTSKSCPNTSRKPATHKKAGRQDSSVSSHPKSLKVLPYKRLESEHSLRDTKSSPKTFAGDSSRTFHKNDDKDSNVFGSYGKCETASITSNGKNISERNDTPYKSKIPVSANAKNVSPKKASIKDSKTDVVVRNSKRVLPFSNKNKNNYSDTENVTAQDVTNIEDQEIKESSTDEQTKPVEQVPEESEVTDVKVKSKVEQKYTYKCARLEHIAKLFKLAAEKEQSVLLSSQTSAPVEVSPNNYTKSPPFANDYQETPQWTNGKYKPSEWLIGPNSQAQWPYSCNKSQQFDVPDLNSPSELSNSPYPTQQPYTIIVGEQWSNAQNSPSGCPNTIVEEQWSNAQNSPYEWPNTIVEGQWSNVRNSPSGWPNTIVEEQWSNVRNSPSGWPNTIVEGQWSNVQNSPSGWPNTIVEEQWSNAQNSPSGCPNTIVEEQWSNAQNSPYEWPNTIVEGQWSNVHNSLSEWPNTGQQWSSPGVPCPNVQREPINWSAVYDIPDNQSPIGTNLPAEYNIPEREWSLLSNSSECSNIHDKLLDLLKNEPITPECTSGQWPSGQIWPQSPRNFPEPTTWLHMVWKEDSPDIDQVGAFGSEGPWPVLNNAQLAETFEGGEQRWKPADLSNTASECSVAEFMRGAHLAPHSSETNVVFQTDWSNTASNQTLDGLSSGSQEHKTGITNGSKSSKNQESGSNYVYLQENVNLGQFSKIQPSGMTLPESQESACDSNMQGSLKSSLINEPLLKFSDEQQSGSVFRFRNNQGSRSALPGFHTGSMETMSTIKFSDVQPSGYQKTEKIQRSQSLQDFPVQEARVKGTNHIMRNVHEFTKQSQPDLHASINSNISDDIFLAGSYKNKDENMGSLKNSMKHSDYNNHPQNIGPIKNEHTGFAIKNVHEFTKQGQPDLHSSINSNISDDIFLAGSYKNKDENMGSLKNSMKHSDYNNHPQNIGPIKNEHTGFAIKNVHEFTKQGQPDLHSSINSNISDDIFLAGSYKNKDENMGSLKNSMKHSDYNNHPQNIGPIKNEHTGFAIKNVHEFTKQGQPDLHSSINSNISDDIFLAGSYKNKDENMGSLKNFMKLSDYNNYPQNIGPIKNEHTGFDIKNVHEFTKQGQPDLHASMNSNISDDIFLAGSYKNKDVNMSSLKNSTKHSDYKNHLENIGLIKDENTGFDIKNVHEFTKQSQPDLHASLNRNISDDIFLAGSYKNKDENMGSLKNSTKRTRLYGISEDPKLPNCNNPPQNIGPIKDVHTGFDIKNSVGNQLYNSVKYNAVKENPDKKFKKAKDDNFEVEEAKFLDDVVLDGAYNKENEINNSDGQRKCITKPNPVDSHSFDQNKNNIQTYPQSYKNQNINVIQNAQNPNFGSNDDNYITYDKHFQYVKYSASEFDIQSDIENNNCKYIFDQNLQVHEAMKNYSKIANENPNIQYNNMSEKSSKIGIPRNISRDPNLKNAAAPDKLFYYPPPKYNIKIPAQKYSRIDSGNSVQNICRNTNFGQNSEQIMYHKRNSGDENVLLIPPCVIYPTETQNNPRPNMPHRFAPSDEIRPSLSGFETHSVQNTKLEHLLGQASDETQSVEARYGENFLKNLILQSRDKNVCFVQVSEETHSIKAKCDEKDFLKSPILQSSDKKEKAFQVSDQPQQSFKSKYEADFLKNLILQSRDKTGNSAQVSGKIQCKAKNPILQSRDKKEKAIQISNQPQKSFKAKDDEKNPSEVDHIKGKLPPKYEKEDHIKGKIPSNHKETCRPGFGKQEVQPTYPVKDMEIGSEINIQVDTKGRGRVVKMVKML